MAHSLKLAFQSLKRPTLLVIIVSVFFRFLFLWSMPGLNGDEAYWVVFRDWLHGVGSWAWMTPSHRFLNPIYPGTVAFFLEILPTSIFAVRAAPLIYSLVSIFAAYYLFKPILKPSLFWSFFLITISLPVHLLFARICWEPALIPLCMILILFFLIRRQYLFSSWALFFSLSVHYVCIFMAPLLFFTWLADIIKNRDQGFKKEWVKWFGSILLTLFLSRILAESVQLSSSSLIDSILQRSSDFEGWMKYFGMVFLTFVGTVPMTDFTSIPFDAFFENAVPFFGVFFLLLFLWGIWKYYRRSDWFECNFLVGFLLSLLAMYLITGPGVLQPQLQRYFLWASVPLVFSFALIFDLHKMGRQLSLFLSANFLIFFAVAFYGTFLFGDGGESVYASAPVEPKAAAYEWISDHLQSNQNPALVAAESWWVYWPAKYFLYEKNVKYFHSDPVMTYPLNFENRISDFQDLIKILDQGGFVVGFYSGSYDTFFMQNRLEGKYKRNIFYKNGPRPNIIVWHKN